MAHRFNLAFKTLSSLGIINSIEDLLQIFHAYFVHSQKALVLGLFKVVAIFKKMDPHSWFL
jgi:hypothetical protein